MATTLARMPISEPLRRLDNLALLFQEVFTVIARLRAGRQRLSDAEVFRMQMRNALKSVEQEGLRRGYEMEELRVGTFAVVAFLDEVILASRDPVFQDWPDQTLQLELFGVEVAGEIFYRDVERLLARQDSECLADLLEVHSICLLLGFRGRCNGAKRETDRTLEQLGEKIRRIRGEVSAAEWRPAAPLSPVPLRRRAVREWLPAFALLPRSKQASAEATAEINLHFAEAAKRMRTARGVKQIAALPVVFMLGNAGSAKTNLLVNAGIDAELLAGQAFEEATVIPTRSVNFWYGCGTLFVDPAGAVLADAAVRRRLFRKFAAAHLHSLFPSKTPPARSVVLTVDCGTFFQSGGAETLAATARHFQAVLRELARELQLDFPVYVVFTKADRIPYFRDFMANLSEGEAAEACGVTLSGDQTLSGAFQNLYCFLTEERNALLAREQNANHLATIYEFPREFAKIRPLLLQFLMDLCTPNDVGGGPFLRGFYFTGVRPTMPKDGSPAGQQWLFPKRLFSEVILADHRLSPLKISTFSQA